MKSFSDVYIDESDHDKNEKKLQHTFHCVFSSPILSLMRMMVLKGLSEMRPHAVLSSIFSSVKEIRTTLIHGDI